MAKLLLIEDERILRENTCELLEAYGYDCVTAEHGKDGLKAAIRETPDLIICDISMPKMDGYEVFEVLQKTVVTSIIPFVYLSAKSQKFDIRKGMELGVDDYLTKPFTFEELHSSIKARLDKSERIFKLNDANYRLMIENSLIGIFIVQNEKIIYANSKFVEITGLAIDDVIGETPYSVFSRDRNSLKDDIKNCMENNSVVHREVDFVDENKNHKIFELYGGSLKFENVKSFVGNVLDITEKKNLNKVINETMIFVEENERKRFAKDIHDELGPLLYGVKLHFEFLKKKSENRYEESYKSIDEMLVEAIDTSRKISQNFAPAVLVDYGIDAAIKKFIENISSSGAIQIKYDSNLSNNRIPNSIEIILYRVLKELINNTIKHAKANNISIELKRNNKIISLIYRDDGVGLPDLIENSGMGLRNIEGRIRSINGVINLKNAESHGLVVDIKIDLNNFN